jgi:SSS family solute:Na+ symporter
MGCASDASGMYLVGGFDGAQNSDLVLRLRYEAGKIEVAQLAAKLPIATSSGASAIHKGTLYLTGGIARFKGELDSVGVLLSLDLADPRGVWNKTNRVPGLERIGSIVTAGKDGVYVVGGLPWGSSVGKTGVPSIDDAYRFSPTSGWVALKDPITDFKRVPSLAYGPSHLLLLGAGGGAENARSLMGYDTVTQTWAKLGTLPDGRANTEAVLWNGMIVVPGGDYKVDGGGTTIEDIVLTGTPRRREGAFGFLDYAVVGLYFLAMIGMGVYFSRRENTTDQFFLGAELCRGGP